MISNDGRFKQAALYTELNELQKLKQTAKSDEKAALRQVAGQFEQMFLSMMMKSMREANAILAQGNFLNSSEVGFYQEMLDNQMTLNIAQSQGVGLADVLVQQLGRSLDIPLDGRERDKPAVKPLSESERMLQRALDSAANMAASALLERGAAGPANAEQPPHLTRPNAPAEPLSDPLGAAAEAAAPAAEPLPARFESPQAFVRGLLPLAEKVAGELGVDPKVLLAQAALETGWGRHLVRNADDGSSFNLFNIKADSRWSGARALVNTLEYRDGVAQQELAAFRAYDSYESSFRDYVAFLKGNPRYQQTLEQAGEPLEYLRQLQAAGYATDPEYAEKIERIYQGEWLASGDGERNRG